MLTRLIHGSWEWQNSVLNRRRGYGRKKLESASAVIIKNSLLKNSMCFEWNVNYLELDISTMPKFLDGHGLQGVDPDENIESLLEHGFIQ